MWLCACARWHEVTGPWLRPVPWYLGEFKCIYVLIYYLLIYLYIYIFIFLYLCSLLYNSSIIYLFIYLFLGSRKCIYFFIYFFYKRSRPDLGPTQLPIQRFWGSFLGAGRPEPVVDEWTSSSVKIQNQRRHTSICFITLRSIWTALPLFTCFTYLSLYSDLWSM
jgi:hypothetical protein